MSEYTPTRQELISAWIQAHAVDGWGGPVDAEGRPKERIAEARRGLEEVERAAAEKALLEAADDVELGDWSHHGNHDDHRDAEAEASTWLEKRAATYRLNEGEKQ